jgi:probable HAF family extracellular repeat protein
MRTTILRYSKSVVFVVLMVGAAVPGLLRAQELTSLGDLPGGSFESFGRAVSADGSVVVGDSVSTDGQEAFRWTSTGGMVGLGDLPGGGFQSFGFGVSADGAVVVGNSSSTNSVLDEAFRWTSTGGMVGLGDLPGGDFQSRANDVSADGTVVVGQSDSASGPEAFRWTSTGGMVGLGDLPGGSFESRATAVSADGAVVVGRGISASGVEAFRWTSTSGMVGLGDFPGGSFISQAFDVSADGAVVVGTGNSASGFEAFRWTSTGGMVGLGDLSGGGFESAGLGVSADGSVVVGFGETASGLEAFYWTASDGMESLADVLTANGVSVAGITLVSAEDLSDDGLVVVGIGEFGNGGREAFIARVASGLIPLSEINRSVGQLATVVEATHTSAFSDLGMLSDVALHQRCDRESERAVGTVCGFAIGSLLAHDDGLFDNHQGSGSVGLSWHAFSGLTFGIGALIARNEGDLPYLGSSDIRSVGGGLYASYIQPDGGFELLAAGIVRSLDLDLARGYLNGATPDTSFGDTDGTSWGVLLRAGYGVPLWDRAKLTPFVEYATVGTQIDGYSEDGGAFPATFNDIDDSRQRLRLGAELRAKVQSDLEAWTWAAWNHRFDDGQLDISGELQGLSGFATSGPYYDENGGDAGVGVKWTAAPGITTLAAVGAGFGTDLEPDIFGRVSVSIELGQVN